jgi:integrase
MKHNYIRLQPIQPIHADALHLDNNVSLSSIAHREMLPGFKLYLLKGGRKPRTVQLNVANLNRLLNAVSDLTIENIEGFLAELKMTGRKASYINDYIDTLRHYGRYLQTNYFHSLSYFKEEAFAKAMMSNEEIKAFLKLPPPMITRYDPRARKTLMYFFDENAWNVWTLFFKVLAYSGMRCGEVAHLTVDSVDFGRQVFVLEDTKTNTPRFVPIAPTLIPELRAYIKTLTSNYLFPSKRRRISKRQNAPVVDDVDWGYNFHKRLRILGIKRKNLSPYSLRHSFITRMLDEDIALAKVQKIVGHRRIDTTMHYTHLTTKDIIRAINKDPLVRTNQTITEKLLRIRKILEDQGMTVIEIKDLGNNRYSHEAVEK